MPKKCQPTTVAPNSLPRQPCADAKLATTRPPLRTLSSPQIELKGTKESRTYVRIWASLCVSMNRQPKRSIYQSPVMGGLHFPPNHRLIRSNRILRFLPKCKIRTTGFLISPRGIVGNSAISSTDLQTTSRDSDRQNICSVKWTFPTPALMSASETRSRTGSIGGGLNGMRHLG